jgi:hypothetical protein
VNDGLPDRHRCDDRRIPREPKSRQLRGFTGRSLDLYRDRPGTDCRRQDKRDLAGIDSLVSAYPVIHIDAAIGQLAYDLLKQYAKSHGLRAFDSLIAATAISRGFELVSRNRKHFAMIDGLRLESPRY